MILLHLPCHSRTRDIQPNPLCTRISVGSDYMDTMLLLGILAARFAMPTCRLLSQYTPLLYQRRERKRIPHIRRRTQTLQRYTLERQLLLENIPERLHRLHSQPGAHDTRLSTIHCKSKCQIPRWHSCHPARKVPQRQSAVDEIHQHIDLQQPCYFFMVRNARQPIVALSVFRNSSIGSTLHIHEKSSRKTLQEPDGRNRQQL